MLGLSNILPSPSAAFARLINSLMKQEEWAQHKLMQHGDKTVQIGVANLNLSLHILPSGLVQQADSEQTPDVHIHIPRHLISQIPQILGKDTSQITRIMHIQGDAALAQTVSELAQNLRWDAGHNLSKVFGNIVARRLLMGQTASAQAASYVARNIARNIGEYMAHESALLANRPAMNEFSARLQQVNQQISSLEQRVAKIKAKDV